MSADAELVEGDGGILAVASPSASLGPPRTRPERLTLPPQVVPGIRLTLLCDSWYADEAGCTRQPLVERPSDGDH